MERPTIQVCVDFHGHLWGGVTLGYVMSRFAMEKLGAKRGDALYCIAEFQNCMTDAVQLVTGCTAGKGNLALRPIGKRAMTLVRRDTGEGFRVTIDFTFPEDGTKEENAMLVLREDAEKICKAVPVKIEVPKKKHASFGLCAGCGEEFDLNCGTERDGKIYCPDCTANC